MKSIPTWVPARGRALAIGALALGAIGMLVVLLAAPAAGVLAPSTIPIEPPATATAVEAPAPDLISSLNVQLQIEQAALRDAIDAFVPRTFSGRELDPIAAASDDTLEWSLQIGAASLGADGQALSFRIPITHGSVRVTGRVGSRRKSRGALGWLQKITGLDIDETVTFDGAVSGTLRPRLNADWTLDPNLSAHVSLSRADAQLFGGILKVSLREAISQRIDEQVREQVERLRRRLAEDGRIVSAVQRVWEAMHAVVPLSREPPVWLSWQPVTLAASALVADEERVTMTVGTTVRVGIDVARQAPMLTRSALPPPTTPSPDAAIALRVPVTMRLEAFEGLPPARLGLPERIEHPRGTIAIESLSIHGVADELVIAAQVNAAIDWLPDMRATLYVTGRPVLDRQSNRLHLADARYDLNTRNALLGAADFLLEPAILRQIEQRSVFAILETEQELLARARDELALIEASMPAWADTRLQIDSGQISSVVAEQGWLVAVLDVTGRASIRVQGLGELLATPPSRTGTPRSPSGRVP